MSNSSSTYTFRPLHGSCSCGRNHLSINLPDDAATAGRQALVYFDNSRHLPTPLLRVPLTWVSSSTIALFPDETHTTIRRTFTPANAPHVKQVFCGYCGTQLSRWSEQPRDEADFLNVMLDTLGSHELDLLEELDLLQQAAAPAQEPQAPTATAAAASSSVAAASPTPTTATATATRQGRLGALDWYEELIEGSLLGRTLQTRRGLGATADGSTTVQWEVSEWTDGGSDQSEEGGAAGPPKRKAGEIEADADADADVGMST